MLWPAGALTPFPRRGVVPQSLTCVFVLSQEIHAKIMSLGFSDCKVYISNVDSQSSAEGGHILQVIGEMSNKSLPWRKFSQTFFLAEQPNGYFVLNDICRYIKEEGDEEEGKEEDALPNHDLAFGAEQPVYAAPGAPTPVVDVAPVDAPIVTNGVHHEEEIPVVVAASLPTPPQAAIIVQEAPIVEVVEPVVVEAPVVEAVKPVVAAPLPVVEAPIAPLPAPTVVAPLPTPAPVVVAPTPTPTPAPVAAPAPIAAPAPKSWANLAASNQTKWGAQAVVSKTTSAAPIAPPAPSSSSDRQKSAPKSSSDSPPFATSVMAITSTSCFVKGVVETVSDKALRDLLVTRFGPLRELDIKRSKACAFIEFESLLSARRAIQVSLRVQEGGEGSIVVDREGGGFDLINVVTKKATADRPVSNSTRGGRVGGDGGAGGRGGGGEDRGAKNGGYGRGANEEGGRSAGGNGGVKNGASATRGSGAGKTGGAGAKSGNNK